MSNIKKSNRGFTLVELLIVIVVIAILAAISIVAYNGIQNRAKNTSAEALASQVVTKAQAYNTIQGSYPADRDAFEATGAPEESDLEGINVVPGPINETANDNLVGYEACGTGNSGANITYRTFGPNGVGTKTVGNCS